MGRSSKSGSITEQISSGYEKYKDQPVLEIILTDAELSACVTEALNMSNHGDLEKSPEKSRNGYTVFTTKLK